mmetsp:Transcript_9719/g.27290  ORF Transcript_9719/g.27290 Transcript_9719/m.27290 type:complete len:749 (+) Transcript_9719:76-2322(+)
MEEDVSLFRCKICLVDAEEGGGDLLRPCLCRGSIKYVHESCLKEWIQSYIRANERVPSCEVCKSEYEIRYSRPHESIIDFLCSEETPPLLTGIYLTLFYTFSYTLFVISGDAYDKLLAGISVFLVALLGSRWVRTLRKGVGGQNSTFFLSVITELFHFVLFSQVVGYLFLGMHWITETKGQTPFLDYIYRPDYEEEEGMGSSGDGPWGMRVDEISWRNSGMLMLFAALWLNFLSMFSLILSSAAHFFSYLVENLHDLQSVWTNSSDDMRSTFILVVHTICVSLVWIIPCKLKPFLLVCDVVFLLSCLLLLRSNLSRYLDLAASKFAVLSSLMYLGILGTSVMLASRYSPANFEACRIWKSCDALSHPTPPHFITDLREHSVVCILSTDMLVPVHVWGFSLFGVPVVVAYAGFKTLRAIVNSCSEWQEEPEEVELVVLPNGEIGQGQFEVEQRASGAAPQPTYQISIPENAVEYLRTNPDGVVCLECGYPRREDGAAEGELQPDAAEGELPPTELDANAVAGGRTEGETRWCTCMNIPRMGIVDFLFSDFCPVWLPGLLATGFYFLLVLGVFGSLFFLPEKRLQGEPFLVDPDLAVKLVVGAVSALAMGVVLGNVFLWWLGPPDAGAGGQHNHRSLLAVVVRGFTVYSTLLLVGIILVWYYDMYSSTVEYQEKPKDVIFKSRDWIDEEALRVFVRWKAYMDRIQWANLWSVGMFLCGRIAYLLCNSVRNTYSVWKRTGGGDMRIISSQD